MQIAIDLKPCINRERLNALTEELGYILREYPDIVKGMKVKP